jgi:hypothetical protein
MFAGLPLGEAEQPHSPHESTLRAGTRYMHIFALLKKSRFYKTINAWFLAIPLPFLMAFEFYTPATRL